MRPPRSHESLRGSFSQRSLPAASPGTAYAQFPYRHRSPYCHRYPVLSVFRHLPRSLSHNRKHFPRNNRPYLLPQSPGRSYLRHRLAEWFCLLLIHNDRCCRRNVSPALRSLYRSHRKPQHRCCRAHKVLSRKAATPFPFHDRSAVFPVIHRLRTVPPPEHCW